jgi:hypothetical protein
VVRPHLVKGRPPRSLFVPFELGRPLGEPNDAAFQHRVLRQALALLEREDGPVILEDFAEDAPGAHDRPDWLPPVTAQDRDMARDAADWQRDLAAEMAAIHPAWAHARRRSGRTTIGVSGQAPDDWPAFAAALLAGGLPVVAAHPTPALALRFLADDLKAFYGEAAQAGPVAPSSRQVNRWFWQRTVAGALLIALRAACVESSNSGLRTVASRFLVPRAYLPE